MSFTPLQLEHVNCFAETGGNNCFPSKIFLNNLGIVVEIPGIPYPTIVEHNPYFPCEASEDTGLTESNINEDTEWIGNGSWNSTPWDRITVSNGATLSISNVCLLYTSDAADE